MSPGILAGAVTAFAAGLGEFGAVITFASNIPGETQTLPLAIYSATQTPGGEATAARLAARLLRPGRRRAAAGGVDRAAHAPPARARGLMRGWLAFGATRSSRDGFALEAAFAAPHAAASRRCSAPPAAARPRCSPPSPGCCGRRTGAWRWAATALLDTARGVFMPPERRRCGGGVPGCAALPAPQRGDQPALRPAPRAARRGRAGVRGGGRAARRRHPCSARRPARAVGRRAAARGARPRAAVPAAPAADGRAAGGARRRPPRRGAALPRAAARRGAPADPLRDPCAGRGGRAGRPAGADGGRAVRWPRGRWRRSPPAPTCPLAGAARRRRAAALHRAAPPRRGPDAARLRRRRAGRAAPAGPPGTRLRIRVRARDVAVATEVPRGLSTHNMLPAELAAVAPGRTGRTRPS